MLFFLFFFKDNYIAVWCSGTATEAEQSDDLVKILAHANFFIIYNFCFQRS